MKLKHLFLIFLLIMPVSASFNPVRPNKEAWTCYDYTMNFSEYNPDWGMVTMGKTGLRGATHMVNYKYISENELLIHDGYLNSDYRYVGWQYDGYFHFYINETPRRNYKWLVDNRELVG